MAPPRKPDVERPCRVCGKPMMVRPRVLEPRCFDCGVRAQIENLRQNHEKSGPIYERIARKQYLYWLGEVNRLGITFDVDDMSAVPPPRGS